MEPTAKKFTSVDEYIDTFPEHIKERLEEIRQLIKSLIPNAAEVISYNMPAYKQHGVLVYFAGYKAHIGFYPTSSGIRLVQDELGDLKSSKGAIQFPIDQPVPADLVKKIVLFRAEEDAEKQKLKGKKK